MTSCLLGNPKATVPLCSGDRAKPR